MDKIPSDLKKKIWANFDEYRVVYLATSEKNRPQLRPVTLVFVDSRFYILTGTDDAKVKQIKENAMVELCLPLECGENTGYARMSGKAIIIDHGNNVTTLYAHLSKQYVKRSVKMKKGQVIGLVGDTGWATGPHLHFEVRINAKVKNPINYLPKL